ncbi:MAG: glycosyltransferase family 2 protein [Polyangiales bacterium]
MTKSIAIVVCFNTAPQTRAMLAKFPSERDYDVVFVNDGSTDGTREILDASGFAVVHHDDNRGVGAAIKTGLRYGIDRGYEVGAILAGNDKDDPAQIPDVLAPVVAGRADYVQGSRFQNGGGHDNLPTFRYVMVKVHAQMFRVLTGFNGTDALNGFRAFRLSIFNGPEGIDIWQEWLDRYELETYAHYKILKEPGLVATEVGVTKTYPPRDPNKAAVKYSHIRPVLDWWVILRPLVYLGLRIRK